MKAFILSRIGYTIIGKGYAKRHYAMTMVPLYMPMDTLWHRLQRGNAYDNVQPT